MDCKYYHIDQFQGEWCEKYPDAEFPRCHNRGGCEYKESQQTSDEINCGKVLQLRRKAYKKGYDKAIEKACKWLSNMPIEDMCYKYDNFDTSEGWHKMIEDFKNYMEGE